MNFVKIGKVLDNIAPSKLSAKQAGRSLRNT